MATNMISQERLPLSVQQVAAAQQLGAFVKVYGSSIVRTSIGALVFLVAGILFFVGGTIPTDETVATRSVLVIFAVLFVGTAIYLLYTVIQAANQQVYLSSVASSLKKGVRRRHFPGARPTRFGRVLPAITAMESTRVQRISLRCGARMATR